MATYQTMDDLRQDALFLAGEVPSDTSGSYYAKALDYVQQVYWAVLRGGSLGPDSLPAVDWWWANSTGDTGQPTTQPVFTLFKQVTGTGTLTLTQNSATATLSIAPSAPLTSGHYLWYTGSPSWWAKITTSSGTSVTLETNFPGTTVTATTSYVIAPLEPTFPSANILRIGSMLIPANSALPEVRIVDPNDLEALYPVNLARVGNPVYAAMIGVTRTSSTQDPTWRLRFSHYVTEDTQYRPNIVSANSVTYGASDVPMFPPLHRRTLSFGAAYLLLVDKSDQNAAIRYEQFKDGWYTLAMEQVKNTSQGGGRYGRTIARPLISAYRPLRTTSGLIIG